MTEVAGVTNMFGGDRIPHRTLKPEPEPKRRWWQRKCSQCEQPPRPEGRFAELPSTVLELTGITAVSTGLYQIAAPVGWIGTGLMLVAMGVASSPRTAVALAARSAARARRDAGARVKGQG